jgi:phosphohistidine swiveling domain-containing protein
MAADKWEAPGPGLWTRDESHMSEPPSVATAEVLFPSFEAGLADGFARYGVLLDRMAVANVDGWMYARPRPVGAPKKAGGPPPRLVFSLLLKLHPALRRRRRTAERALASELWRHDAEEWFARGREALCQRLRELQHLDLSAMDDDALSEHLRQVHAITAEALRIHFQHVTAHGLGVGDWLAHVARWTGIRPEEAMQTLRGASPFSVDALEHLDRLVDAMDASSEAQAVLQQSLPPEEALQELRKASPQVGKALDAYMAEYGAWMLGFDIDKPVLSEMPEAVVTSITAHKARREVAGQQASTDSIRERVPEAHRGEYDRLFETARLAYQLRDSDAGPCGHWPGGLLRLAWLETARRLLERGSIADTAQVFEAKLAELEALLLGEPGGPSVSELEARVQRRDASRQNPPPVALGEPEGGPPPEEWLPGALRRVNVAIGFGMDSVFGAPSGGEEADTATLRGVAACAGEHEGRACFVMGPEDFDKLQSGDILVAPFTTPAYNVILPIIGGIVTDHGGLLSHAAIVAREYGIPAVVATGAATTTIPDGARVRVDGVAGSVTVVSAPEAQVVGVKAGGRS